VCARLFIHKAIYFYFAEKSFFSQTHAAEVYEPARCILQKFPPGRDAQEEIEQAAERAQRAQEFAAVSN
jgi:hypothetical protein